MVIYNDMINDTRIALLSNPDNLASIVCETNQDRDDIDYIKLLNGSRYNRLLSFQRYINNNTKFIELSYGKQVIIWDGSSWKCLLFSQEELDNILFVNSVLYKLHINIIKNQKNITSPRYIILSCLPVITAILTISVVL